MPELPEVEVTKRALIPHIEGHTIEKLEIRETRLRWPIRVDLLKKIENEIDADVVYCTNMEWKEAMIKLKESNILVIPSSFLTNPVKILIVVVFPAPFGPNRPKNSPSPIEILTPFNATVSP